MTQPTHVSGTIKPLEWDDLPSASLDFPLSYCTDGDDEYGWTVSMTYRECSDELEGGPFPSADAAKAAAQADYEVRIAAQIQPDAEEQFVCPECDNTGLRDSGGTQPWGEAIMLPCCHNEPQQVASSEAGELISKSEIEKELWKIVRHREDQCKNVVTDIQRVRWIAGKLQAESIIHLIRALPAARAEVSVAEAARLPDGFMDLINESVIEAHKAMRRWPQPNYVLTKFAEEAGEVLKAAIHYAEGRETREAVIGEMRQVIAMMLRLWIEGDQVHGLRALTEAGE